MKAFFEKIYKGTGQDFFTQIEKSLEQNEKRFIVTANPEAFMLGAKQPDLSKLLLDDMTTIIADGIGIVKGAEILGINITERIPGVELAEHLLYCGDKLKKSIFLLGAKKDVIEAFCKKIEIKYPNLTIAGSCDGYCDDKDAVFESIKKLSPDIVLVALGMPYQEKLIYKHLNDFNKGIFVGVGGSFDVLSGCKKRAPQFFINHNIEWLYRIAKEPKRIKRFYNNNIKFLFEVKKIKKSGRK